LIGASILRRLGARPSVDPAIEAQLGAVLESWRGRPEEEQGYGPGNVVNLLRLLRGDLRAVDLSRLHLRQVYLQAVDAQDTSPGQLRRIPRSGSSQMDPNGPRKLFSIQPTVVTELPVGSAALQLPLELRRRYAAHCRVRL
jgi:hypothetical protein